MSSEIKGQVFSFWKPPAKAGETVTIKVVPFLTKAVTDEHLLSLTGPNEVSLAVQGPQLTLEPSDIVGVYPAPGSEESPDEYLPHIALAGRTLPWERRGPKDHLPWMALLLIAETELSGPRRVRRSGSGVLLAASGAAGKIGPTTVEKVEASDPVTFERLTVGLNLSPKTQFFAAQLPNKLLQNILPIGANIDRLSLLCHAKRTLRYYTCPDHADVRGTGPGSCPRCATTLQALPEDAAIVISNRLPNAGNPDDAIEPAMHTALLVSLEQRTDLLHEDRFADVNAATVFVVLHHWSFTPSDRGDFEEVMKLIRIRPNGGVLRFGNLPRTGRGGGQGPLTEKFEAMLDKDGYFRKPLPHEQPGAVAFRSPLRPFATEREEGFAVRAAPEEFTGSQGEVDYSHAAAFEIGRLMALGDATILEDLRNIHGVMADRIVDKDLVNPLPDALQKPDWVTNEKWQTQPWNVQQASLLRTEADLTKDGVADYSGIEHLAKNWKQNVANEMAAISAPAMEVIDQIDIVTVTGETLARKFGQKAINVTNI